MKDQEVLSKVRIFLREEGVIVPKGHIKEFYSQLMKLSGFGIGGLLVFSGKKAGKMTGTYIKNMLGEKEPIEKVAGYVGAFLEESGICKVESYQLSDTQITFIVRDSRYRKTWPPASNLFKQPHFYIP